jgi:hypothetical protein
MECIEFNTISDFRQPLRGLEIASVVKWELLVTVENTKT